MFGRAASVFTLVSLISVQPSAPQSPGAGVSGQSIAPTPHPALPSDPAELWLAPSGAAGKTGRAGALVAWARGVELYEQGKFAEALPILSARAAAKTPLADYAEYYTALTLTRLSRFDEARQRLEALAKRPLEGYLTEGVPLAAAEAAAGAGDHAAAASYYEQISRGPSLAPDDVLLRLGREQAAAGESEKAKATFRRLRYEYALSDSATLADAELTRLGDALPTRETFTSDFDRAERLFSGRRYAEARSAFQALQPLATGEQKEIADLRVAESDFYLKRYASARDGTRPYLDQGARRAEAQFFHLASLRELGEHDEYVRRVRALVEAFPESSWAEEALNNLGTHLILMNDDEAAAVAFAELYRRFPKGPRAERAAWKAGWWAYKTGSFAETIRLFESAAVAFPRSDYRPSYLYWAARAHEQLEARSAAISRYRVVVADYQNSYYGRLAEKRLEPLEKASRASRQTGGQGSPDGDAIPPAQAGPPATLPANADRIRLLLSLDLLDAALKELRYAERTGGPSPPVQATIAWVHSRQGDLRRAITLMRRAYPHHMTAGANSRLPDELLRVIFPLEYWSNIRRNATARDLDPYLIAALIAQESTFDPEARSSANAWGLMQLVPATGRRLARSVGIRRFRTAMLTQPDVNIRLGTTYFARLVDQFGGVHLALASYNAGESRVVRWVAERPGLERDEFIDDIPFPETQNYVKRILGTAEDYRSLYGRQ
jgi:soluble lytic murein transglycosylase